MINNFYSSISNGNQVEKCSHKQHYVPEQPYLLKNNFLSEFRTALEKAKVRANLGIADSETLYWGNIQGDIADQTDISEYINSLLSFDYSAEKGFDSGTNFENITNVKEAAITCLDYLSKFKGEGEEINAVDTKVTEIIKLLYGVDSLTKVNSSTAGIINTLIKEVSDLQAALGNTDTTVEEIETRVTTVESAIDTINESLAEINNLIKISTEADNALTLKEDGLYVKDLSKEVSSNASEITQLHKDVQTLEEKSKDYLTKEDFGSDDLDFVSETELTSTLNNYVKTNSDAVLKSVTINKITSSKGSITVDKPFDYQFEGPSDVRTHVKTQADLLKINPAKAWKGMPVIVEEDAIMYILTKEPSTESIGTITNWKSADSLSIEVLTYDEYKEKKTKGTLNPGVYYYIIEDDVELSEIPSINQYINEDGTISSEKLEAYQQAIDTWYADAEKLHREYMSAVWGVDMERKLSNKVNTTEYNHLKSIVEQLKHNSVDIATVTTLQEQMLSILGDLETPGRLVKVEDNLTQVLQDLYATDAEGNALENVSPKFVTWEALGSDNDNIGDGQSLFVKTSTYNADKETFLYKDQQAQIPSIKASNEDFSIEKKDSEESLLTVKNSGEVLNASGTQLGYDKDIPYLVMCDSLEEYKEKIQEEITDNPNGREVFYIIKDLDPEINEGNEDCYITFSQLKQYAASKRQIQDLSKAWGEYRKMVTGDSTTDQLGNQLYDYESLSSIVKDWKNTVIPEEITKQLVDKVSTEDLKSGLATKLDTTVFDAYKEEIAKSQQDTETSITTLQNSITTNTSSITELQESKLDSTAYQEDQETISSKITSLEENSVTKDVYNEGIEQVTTLAKENSNLVEITYAELAEAINSSTLIPGTFYKLTDFKTSVSDQEAYSVNPKSFQLVIKALSTNSISSTCSAISEDYPNAYKWKIEYSIQGGTTGTILSLTDELGNYAPFDFKSILVKKYKVVKAGVDLDSVDSQWISDLYIGSKDSSAYTISENDYKYVFTFSTEDYNDASETCTNNQVSSLGNIIFGGSNNKCEGTNNIIYLNCQDVCVAGTSNLVGNGSTGITVKSNTENNIIYNNCSNVSILEGSKYNIVYAYNTYIDILENCISNIIAEHCSHVILHGRNTKAILDISYAQGIDVQFGSSNLTFNYGTDVVTGTNKLLYSKIEIYGNTGNVSRVVVKADTNQALVTTFYLEGSEVVKYEAVSQATNIASNASAINSLQTMQTQQGNSITSLATQLGALSGVKTKINEIIKAINELHQDANLKELS